MMACLNAMPIRAGLDVHLCNDFARAGFELCNLRNNAGPNYSAGILWATRINRRRYFRTNNVRRYLASTARSITTGYVGTSTSYGNLALVYSNYRSYIGPLNGTHLHALNVIIFATSASTMIPTTTPPISGIQNYLVSFDSTSRAIRAQVNEHVLTGSYEGELGNTTNIFTGPTSETGDILEKISFSRTLSDDEFTILSRYLRYRRMP